MTNRQRSTFIAAAALFALAACNSTTSPTDPIDETPGPTASIQEVDGTYALVVADGHELPYRLGIGPESFSDVVADTIVIAGDRFTRTLVARDSGTLGDVTGPRAPQMGRVDRVGTNGEVALTFDRTAFPIRAWIAADVMLREHVSQYHIWSYRRVVGP